MTLKRVKVRNIVQCCDKGINVFGIQKLRLLDVCEIKAGGILVALLDSGSDQRKCPRVNQQRQRQTLYDVNEENSRWQRRMKKMGND